MVAVVGLVEFELPPVDVGVVLDRIKRAPSGLSGVFTLSFVSPEDKNLRLLYNLQTWFVLQPSTFRAVTFSFLRALRIRTYSSPNYSILP